MKFKLRGRFGLKLSYGKSAGTPPVKRPQKRGLGKGSSSTS